MAEKKYLDYEGLRDVAGNVNTRLKTVTTMPATAADGAVRLYAGATSGSYTKGHIYQYSLFYEWRYSHAHIYTKSETPAVGEAVYNYDGIQIGTISAVSTGQIEVDGIPYTSSGSTMSKWVDISATIDPTLYATTFTGTRAEWDALTPAEKQEYVIVNITDDMAEGGAVVVDEVTEGNMNAVTSDAVAKHLVMDTINLGEITVSARTNYAITLSDYSIDTHNKPWMAFVYNRSNWGEFNLFGDGATTLILRNTTDSSVTGNMVIAVLHYGV